MVDKPRILVMYTCHFEVLFERDQFDCLHKSYMCNGVNDTSSGADEDEETCRKVKGGHRTWMGV